MSVKTFPLEVFDFGVSLSSIILTQWALHTVEHTQNSPWKVWVMQISKSTQANIPNRMMPNQ